MKAVASLGPFMKRVLVRIAMLAGAGSFLLLVPVTIIALLGHPPSPEERRVLLLLVPVTGVTLFMYLRMRGDIERFVRRVVYGRSSSADELLDSISGWVHERIPIEDLLLHVVASLRRELSLAAAEVWTVSGGQLLRTCSSPERGAGTLPLLEVAERAIASADVAGRTRLRMWIPDLLGSRSSGPVRGVPVTHSGRLQGILVVERSHGADPFDVEEDAVLMQVARQLGLVLALEASFDELRRHAVELRHSRARLVAAADEARRQIERNLHDGAQNHLVVIVGTLHEAAEKLGTGGAPEVLALIEEARHALEESVHELRNLAHGVFPPVLADRGLTEALRSAARRMKLPVTLEAEGFDRLDAELETAVYFCCLEALQNVKKHAGDSASVDIRLRSEQGKFHFEVTDNGQGFDLAASGGGAGLLNMRDRLEAVGGHLSVIAGPDNGCTVQGDIPLPAERRENSSALVPS